MRKNQNEYALLRLESPTKILPSFESTGGREKSLLSERTQNVEADNSNSIRVPEMATVL